MKQQRHSGYVMDGFIPRRRGGSPSSRRPSLDKKNVRETSRRPYKQVASEPLALEPIKKGQKKRAKETWTDATTLQIEPEELLHDQSYDIDEGEQPKWWQVRKKQAEKRDRKQKKSTKKPIKKIVLIILAILLLAGGFLGWKFLKNTAKIFNGNVLGFFESTKLRGEEQGRVNILLAGTSEDNGPLHGGADLTDSIMVASIDTKNNTGFTMSIPRDLWVNYGQQCSAGYQGKINVAYQCGEDVEFQEEGYPNGGMGLLRKIVSENFGIPIHYHGKISYNAFKDAVNAVDGIEVKVDSDDPRGIYDPNFQPEEGGPLKLSNGRQTLDGQTALRLARSRNSAGGYGMSRGDFDRTAYQQAMLLALKDKGLSAGVITNPAKLGDLLDAAGDNITTDFQSSEVRRLYELAKLIQNDSVKTVDLASEDIALLTTGAYNGQSIVRPVAGINDFREIKLYMKKMTSNDPVVKEAATVVVLNGSSVLGLAQKRADELALKGINVVSVGNAEDATTTTIIDQTSGTKNGTKKVLEQHLNVLSTTVATTESQQYEADFIIILGRQSSADSRQ